MSLALPPFPAKRVSALAAALLATVVAAGCAVTPSVEFEHSSFEGFDVISYVPENPRGLVFVFHGSNGSAAHAERLESVDALNRLIGQGYGFVSTSSTERTGDRRWDVFNASLTGNPDLARLGRLYTHFVNTTPVTATTPIVGMGMSNGARFVTLWGQSWRNAGRPVKAIWASMGRTAPAYAASGALTVPTVFSTAVNDFTVPPGDVVESWYEANQAGTPAELLFSHERRLSNAPYLRIPGVDDGESRQIVQALKDTGAWNGDGQRVVSPPEAAATQAGTVRLPASVAGAGRDIADETAVQLAVHQFTAEHIGKVTAFFDRFVPPRPGA
jgi:hypothetical protein